MYILIIEKTMFETAHTLSLPLTESGKEKKSIIGNATFLALSVFKNQILFF